MSFRKGDEVVYFDLYTYKLIPGVVATIKNNEKYYPVKITLENDNEVLCTMDGKTHVNSEVAKVFHKGTKITFDIAPEPNRHQNLEVDDLVWVWENDYTRKAIRCFSHVDKDGYVYVFISGYTSHAASDTFCSKHFKVVKK